MQEPSDRETKRAAILLAVLQVIAARGLDAVSFRSVAAQAGVSVGAVQHHFATKQELIRAAVAFVIELAESRHGASGPIAGANPRSPEDELWALLAHALPVASESPAGTSVFYSFVAASVADPVIAEILGDAKSGVEDAVTRLLVELRPGVADPHERARHLLALSDGLTLHVLIGRLSAAEAEASLRAALDADRPA